MKKFLKTPAAAKYLGVSRSSLTNWVRQGLITGGLTPGGHYRFSVDELDRFASGRGLNIPMLLNDTTKILLIDDDKAFRDFISDALEVFEGYELREAKDGIEGALIAGSWTPDLVIADLRMPNMNGIEFCRILRKNENTEDVEVIVASAYLSEKTKDELEKLNVKVALEKPVRLTSLVAAIEKCTGLKLK